MAIFRENAQKYWDEGVPVIPLKRNDKMPWIVGWQKFALTMPTLEEQETWLRMYGEGNIGLPLGPAAGIDGVDIDSIDQKVVGLLEKMLPKTYWKRVGAKGYMLAYRHNPKLRSFNLKQKNGGMIIEMLSKGRQMVLPPSQHPTTGRPYTANAELLDVKSILPELPSDIEIILRGALRDIGVEVGASGSTKVTDFVAAGARDTDMVRVAGIFASDVRHGKITLLEALGMMDQWVKDFTEKVAGDDLDPAKAQSKVVEFLVRDLAGSRRSVPTGWDAGLSEEDKTNLGVNFGDNKERWNVGKILSYLMDEFNRHTDQNSSGFRAAVDAAIAKIAANPDEIKALDTTKILNFINGAGGKNYPVATLKKMLADEQKGDMVGDNHTEIAKKTQEDLSKDGEICFSGGGFRQWKGAFWGEKQSNEIIVYIQNNFGHLPAARKQGDHQAICRAVSNQTTKELVVINQPTLNFANGVLDEDRVLHPHHPDYGHKYVLKYRYLPEEAGKCPMFFQFLHDCWGEDPDFQEKVDALQEAMAATLFGVAPKYQRVFCMKGQAKTGKTRIINIMQGLMPENCTSSIPPTDWGEKFGPAQMFGKLMNICGEISEKRLIDGDRFKEITEGHLISAQHKNQQRFDFKPTCAQWFAGNHLPKTKDTSDGWNRRWLFLEFDQVVSDEDKVVDIDKVILAAEREQIAAWAVQGLERLKRNNGEYTLPVSHMRLVDQMAAENNSVHYFLADCPRLMLGREAHRGRSETHITETQLHHVYSLFCISMGLARPVTQRRFHVLMKDLARHFGFKQQIKLTDRHGMLTEYEWITLVSEKAAA